MFSHVNMDKFLMKVIRFTIVSRSFNYSASFSMWELLNAEHSHIAQVTVPLLLHCVTLPCGADTFWRLVQEEFHNSDWRVRFVAGNYVPFVIVAFYYFLFTRVIYTSIWNH